MDGEISTGADYFSLVVGNISGKEQLTILIDCRARDGPQVVGSDGCCRFLLGRRRSSSGLVRAAVVRFFVLARLSPKRALPLDSLWDVTLVSSSSWRSGHMTIDLPLW